MFKLLRKHNLKLLIILIIVIVSVPSFYNRSCSSDKLVIDIYTIDFCPYCQYAKKIIPTKLKESISKEIDVNIINIDKYDNETKYINTIKSLEGFREEHKNIFPLIDIKNYFVIVVYDRSYTNEIINDIVRNDKKSNLGKKLENIRYIRSDENE